MKRISTLVQENSIEDDFDFDLLEIEELDDGENVEYESNSFINKREITTHIISLTSKVNDNQITFNWNKLNIDDFFHIIFMETKLY